MGAMEALGRVELPTNGLGSVKPLLILKRFNKIALQNANKYGRIRKLSANRFQGRTLSDDCLPRPRIPCFNFDGSFYGKPLER